MKKIFLITNLLILLIGCQSNDYVKTIEKNYFPAKGDWKTAKPEDLGMNSKKLDEAVKMFRKIATGDRAQVWYAKDKDPKEFQKVLLKQYFKDTTEIAGPMKARSGINMMVIRKGYIVAKYGDVDSPDMLGRATRGFVASLAGLAHKEKLIKNLNRPISKDFPEYFLYGGEKNTWHHFLQSTSSWAGPLWNKGAHLKSDASPGKYFTGNDTHGNLLILLLSRLWNKPLATILKEKILDPIGASGNWQWHGYHNSKYKIDGKLSNIPVSGNHWGGGLWMSSADFARYGLLHLNRGKWNGKQIIPESWIRQSFTPSNAINPHVPNGYMWSLRYNYKDDTANQNVKKPLGLQVIALLWGRGYRIVYLIPEYQIVVVTSFIPPIGLHGDENPVLSKILEAVDPKYMEKDIRREKNFMIVIQGIYKGSPAYKLGLKVNDIIYKINGEEVYGLNSIKNARKKAVKLNKKIIMTIIRDGRELTVDITKDAFGLAPGVKIRNIKK